MRTLLDSVYYKLRREEIEKASTRFRRIKTDTILKNLSKLCWKYNIQYEIIIKTRDILVIRLTSVRETVVLKYHNCSMVSSKEIDAFMNELDEVEANRGIYITTGYFETRERQSFKNLFFKKDILLEDGLTFIKGQLGLTKKTIDSFKISKLDFFKYLPN
ncbi:hypothetical protein HMPREF1982_01245 [Clostridiales bacterium oral taxon 876 str. F0540]|nr:hypothetical protein HMPREF1982_01245 [Clostridiales bacterium oral taxon 876 str. F0540]